MVFSRGTFSPIALQKFQKLQSFNVIFTENNLNLPCSTAYSHMAKHITKRKIILVEAGALLGRACVSRPRLIQWTSTLNITHTSATWTLLCTVHSMCEPAWIIRNRHVHFHGRHRLDRHEYVRFRCRLNGSAGGTQLLTRRQLPVRATLECMRTYKCVGRGYVSIPLYAWGTMLLRYT